MERLLPAFASETVRPSVRVKERREAPPAGRPVRVLFVADHLGYIGGVVHGASHYYLDVLPRLNSGGAVQAAMCVLGRPHPFAPRLEERGVKLCFLGRSKWDPRALADLWRLVRREEVDVLHLLTMKSAMLGTLVARAADRPALIHLHDVNEPGLLLRAPVRWAGRRARAVLVTAEHVGAFAVRSIGVRPDRVVVVPNGVDARLYEQPAAGTRERVRAELGISPDAAAVGVVGRVTEVKGQHVAIRAMATVRQARPDAVLVVVGDGPGLPACRALARRTGAPVVFTGQRTDVPDVLAALDLAVVPSLVPEGFGYAAAEAAAAGLPIVASASGGLRDLVKHGETGLLVQPGDDAELAAAVLCVLSDPALRGRMSTAGRALAEQYGMDRHIGALERVYAALSA